LNLGFIFGRILRARRLDSFCGHLGQELLSYRSTGEVIRAFCSTSVIMSNSILVARRSAVADFVDQLMDDRLALGDLAAFSVDHDEDRLVQRIGKRRMQLLFTAAAGVAGLPFRKRVCNRGRSVPTL
jgi:hypothetical protein